MTGEDFRGNIYVVQGDDALYQSAAGFADLANGVPNELDTRFASASAGKVFVAVGILQQIERGRLDFDDALGALLDLDLHQIDGEITIRQLLTHTSGMPDYFDESVMSDYEALWRERPNYSIRHNRDLLPLFMDKPMMFPRGTRFQYNNAGYVLLAMILEQLTGLDFDAYLQASVFDVCGMAHTGYYELDRLPAKCANSYIYCPETRDYRTNIYSVDAKGTGAGGAFVTVGDIVRFWRGLLSGKLMSHELAADMLSRHSGDGVGEEGGYGYGVWIASGAGGAEYPYFQGSDPGVSFISEYNPGRDMICTLVSNYGDMWQMMRELRRTLY